MVYSKAVKPRIVPTKDPDRLELDSDSGKVIGLVKGYHEASMLVKLSNAQNGLAILHEIMRHIITQRVPALVHIQTKPSTSHNQMNL